MDETFVRNNSSETSSSLDADRVALNNMFRAIAAYGRKVRLRRQAECSVSRPADAQKEQHVEEPKGKQKRKQRTN